MTFSSSESSLVDVSTPFVLLSASPLLLIILASYSMDLKLESPIIVGCIRTFIQLSILGLILQPIFVLGEQYWWVVVAYVLLMVVITSYESASRSTYYFRGMFGCVLISLLINITAISLFAFGLVIQPQPVLWEPQYVIPIIGMLLGNIINGISLSLNAMLTSLVEDQPEVDLLLSFGANSVEASSRIVREAVRTGTMPMLNSMTVIGIVAIPGMMTGQILGGTPVMEAARYQMLIMYLIAITVFGTIMTIVFLALRVAFDFSSDVLRTDRLVKREEQRSFLDIIMHLGRSLWRWCMGQGKRQSISEEEPLTADVERTSYVEDRLLIRKLRPSSNGKIHLQVSQLSRSFPIPNSDDRRALFHNVSFTVGASEIVLVGGPSGVGKSQLLRVIAGLSPLESGVGGILLQGVSRNMNDMARWRQRVRYVTQSTVDIPGTPREFVKRIASFRSWQHDADKPSNDEMMLVCRDLVQFWRMEVSCLDKKWSVLSGGEAQRVIVAIALASRPRVLLVDECTSALDLNTKILVEQSVEAFATKCGMSVLWVTHDMEQVKRMSQTI
jgi:putative ABC transport system permease protein